MFRPTDLSNRKFLLGAATLILISLIGFSLVHFQSDLDVRFNSIKGYDTANTLRYTELEVNITNLENQTIEPGFSTFHSEHKTKTFWKIISGPNKLESGETGVYRLKARDPLSAINSNVRFYVEVNDIGTHESSKSSVMLSDDFQYTNVLNPHFKFWHMQYRLFGEQTPDRWIMTRTDRLLKEKTLWSYADTFDISNEDGLNIEISKNEPLDQDSVWMMLGVQQKVPFGSYQFEWKPQQLTNHTEVRENPSGVEIIDRNNRIWILPSDEYEVRKEKGNLDYYYLYIPAKVNKIQEVTVNLTGIYNEMNWSKPPKTQNEIDGEKYTNRWLKVHLFSAIYPPYNRTSEITFTKFGLSSQIQGSSSIYPQGSSAN